MQRLELFLLLREPFWFGFRFAAGIVLGVSISIAIINIGDGLWRWVISAFEYF